MTDPQRTSVSLSPGGWLFLGPLLGICVGNGLYLARAEVRPFVPPPWEGVLTGLALIGQAVFIAVVVLLLVEGWMAFRLAGQVAGLRADDRMSWGGQARESAVVSGQSLTQRLNSLRAVQRSLGRRAERRWLLYAALALVPALIGLAIGLGVLRGMEARSRPFEELFALLVLGSIEGAFLYLLGLVARGQTGRVLTGWLARCEALEKSQVPAVQAPKPKFWQLLAQGRTCARNGGYDKAIDAFEQALVEWPEGGEARQELEKAKQKKREAEEQEQARQREATRLAEEVRKQTEIERQVSKGTAVVSEEQPRQEPEPASPPAFEWPEEHADLPHAFECPPELDPPRSPPPGGPNR